MASLYVEHVRDALNELADADLRRSLWLSSSGEVSSLTECVCRLFDDSGLGDMLDRQRLAFTPEVDDDLRQLRRTLRRVDPTRSPEDVLADPVLGHAAEEAAAILHRLGG